MATRQNSCLLPPKRLSISMTYLLQSLLAMLNFFPNLYVKNLILDSHLTMNEHVSNNARTCYFELCHMVSICSFLTDTATITLVSTVALSRIDYCNSLLFRSTHDVTFHLQWIQIYAARVFLRIPKSCNITTHLKSLQWFPVDVKASKR